jgi:hypothetical protein
MAVSKGNRAFTLNFSSELPVESALHNDGKKDRHMKEV